MNSFSNYLDFFFLDLIRRYPSQAKKIISQLKGCLKIIDVNITLIKLNYISITEGKKKKKESRSKNFLTLDLW